MEEVRSGKQFYIPRPGESLCADVALKQRTEEGGHL